MIVVALNENACELEGTAKDAVGRRWDAMIAEARTYRELAIRIAAENCAADRM